MTRPWQASASSVAPPMQVPSMAATNGLPQVSSFRKRRDSRLDSSKQGLLRRGGSLAPAWLAKVAEHAGDQVMSAPPENVFLPETMTAPLIAVSATTRSMIASSFVHHRPGEDVHRAARHVPGDDGDAVGPASKRKFSDVMRRSA